MLSLLKLLKKTLLMMQSFPAAVVRGCINAKRSQNLNFSIPTFIQMSGKALNATFCRLFLVLVDRHTVCQFCRPKLNGNTMPNRCILNGLITEPVPKQLKELDPLSKRIIQRGKAFQAIIRLGTYMGKVPSYNSLKACKGTMFFLPLPNTANHRGENNTTVGLPDLLYILISGKLSKNKVLWQSLVNVDQVKAAGPTIGFMLM